ncbi:MAG: class I SAM-dependent methyltransferase [Oscillospiraceae bacterium]|nr:class I SAM-dependent methyltransferase [Oscillospiraceae bacterium]
MNRFIRNLYSVAGHWATTACPVIDDRLSYKMLSDIEKQRCSQFAPRSVIPLANSVFMSKAFTGARYAGARQMVMLYAGYETFHIRDSLWYDRIQVFDVNTSHISADKQARLTAAGEKPQTHIAEIVCDSMADCRQLLSVHPAYDVSKTTFIYMADLPVYIDRKSFKHLLEQLFKIIPPYSSVVFSCTGAEQTDYRWLEKLLSDTGYLIYEYMTAPQLHTEYLRDFEILNNRHFILPENISFCVAVKKENRGYIIV